MKKQYILVVILLLLVGTVVTLSIYKYNAEPKDVSAAQALHQRDAALTDLTIQKQLNANDQQASTNQINDLKTQVTTLNTTETTLCTQIKTAKLVQPLCK